MKPSTALLLVVAGGALLWLRSRAQQAAAASGFAGYADLASGFAPESPTIVEAEPEDAFAAMLAAGADWGMTSWSFTTAAGTVSGRTEPIVRDPVAFTAPWTDTAPKYTQQRQER